MKLTSREKDILYNVSNISKCITGICCDNMRCDELEDFLYDELKELSTRISNEIKAMK